MKLLSDPAYVLGQKAVTESRNRLGTVDYRNVAYKIVNFFGEDALRLLNVKVLSDNEPAPWIRRFFYENRGNRPTILYLLLVGAYFGSVSDFEFGASDEKGPKENISRKVVNKERLLQKHREVLKKLLVENQGLSRSAFQKKAPGSYDFLIRHDKEFFQSKISRSNATCLPRRERVDWAMLDASKACELKAYFDNEYNKKEKPEFIMIATALKYCALYSKYVANSSRFPQVSEVLATNLESRDSFHKRRLSWAIVEMNRTRTAISANRLRRVAALELKVLMRNRDFILSTVHETGGTLDDRSFLV